MRNRLRDMEKLSKIRKFFQQNTEEVFWRLAALGQCQAIIWTNAEILLIGCLETNFSEILIEIYTFSFRQMLLKMLYGKWQPFCLRPNVLQCDPIITLPRFFKNAYYTHFITHLRKWDRKCLFWNFIQLSAVNAVQYNKIFYMALYWLKHNINQSVNSYPKILWEFRWKLTILQRHRTIDRLFFFTFLLCYM